MTVSLVKLEETLVKGWFTEGILTKEAETLSVVQNNFLGQ